MKRTHVVQSSPTAGAVVAPVTLSANELRNLRQARELFDELRTLLGEIHLQSDDFLSSRCHEFERFAGAKEVGHVRC